MDNFGRLPNEVIDKIEQIYQKPTLTITIVNNCFYLNIQCAYINHKIDLMHPLVRVDKKAYAQRLDAFIQNLKNNIKCAYYKYFVGRGHVEILFDNDIKINTLSNSITLDSCCIDIFIIAMQQYYDMIIAN